MNAASFNKRIVFCLGAVAFTLSGAVSDGGAPVRIAMTSPVVMRPALEEPRVEQPAPEAQRKVAAEPAVHEPEATIDMDREAERLARIEPAAMPAPAAVPKMIKVASAVSLYQQFTQRGYTLEAVREGERTVPRVFLAALPRDLPALPSPDFRKTVFIKMMLPLVLAENERIRKDRERALAIRTLLEEDRPVSMAQIVWLANLASRYGVTDGDLDELFLRVDIVPPALALAQAALETGWGTSNVAQRGHAMFGQMVFRIEPEGTVASVKMFENLAAAVQAYAFNLNTHRAYADYREVRSKMRDKGGVIDGYELARYLLHYSERKHDYIRAVRGLIRYNNLEPFDRARLAG